MEEEKKGADKFMAIDKFIAELISYHEQIKQLKTSETHYKELAEALQEKLNNYQAIMDHLPLKVFLKDRNLFYLLASKSYARFLGIPSDQIFGKKDHDFFSFELAEQRQNEEGKLMGVGVAEEREERYSREGRERVERAIKIPIQDKTGEILGLAGFFFDITETKAREEELEKKSKELADFLEARNAELREIRDKIQLEQAERRNLEERLKNVEALYSILFENTGTAVALIEDNGIISRVNREFEKISGYSRGDVEGAKNWSEFIQNNVPHHAGESADSQWLNSLDAEMKVFKFVGGQSEAKTVSLAAARIPNTGRFLVSLTDISDYRKAREELNRIMKQFKELIGEMEKSAKDLHGLE